MHRRRKTSVHFLVHDLLTGEIKLRYQDSYRNDSLKGKRMYWNRHEACDGCPPTPCCFQFTVNGRIIRQVHCFQWTPLAMRSFYVPIHQSPSKLSSPLLYTPYDKSTAAETKHEKATSLIHCFSAVGRTESNHLSILEPPVLGRGILGSPREHQAHV